MITDITTDQNLQDIMSGAIQSQDITPPSDPSTLSDIFHSLFVAPAGAPGTGSIAGDIVQYFTRPPATKTQYVLQQGYKQTQTASLFSSPFFWIAIVAVIGLAIWFIKR